MSSERVMPSPPQRRQALTRVWPSDTGRPSAQRTSTTMPSCGAGTAISIFIDFDDDQRLARGDRSPGSTEIFQTLPGTGLRHAVAAGRQPASAIWVLGTGSRPPRRLIALPAQRARSALEGRLLARLERGDRRRRSRRGRPR